MQTNILQADPKAGYLAHQSEIDAAVLRVLASGWYILGREGEAFEAAFAGYIGARHAIGVANGTDAIALALRGLNLPPMLIQPMVENYVGIDPSWRNETMMG